MSLRLKIMLMLFATLAVYGVMDYFFHITFINRSFLHQEAVQAQEHTDHALAILDYETKGLDLLCNDWAAWDDSYAFIKSQGKDAEYIKSNLGQSYFVYNNLNIIYYLDIAGNVVWRDSINHNHICDDINWANTALIKNTSIRSGFLTTASGPMLLVARPITDSDGVEVVNGYIVMGRLITGSTLEEINSHIHGNIEILAQNDNQPLSHSELKQLRESDNILLKPQENTLFIYKGMVCINSSSDMILQLAITRVGTLHGLAMINYNALSNIIAGIITIGIFILFIRRNVIKPISRLTEHVNSINTADDLSTIPLATPSNNEIGILWQGFNKMVQRVQRDRLRRVAAEEALRGQQQRIQAILDTAPDGIITVDQHGIIESLNTAAARMFNYTTKSLEGESISVLAQDEYAQQIIAVLQNYPDTDHYKCFDSGCEMAGRTYDGGYLPVHMRANSVIIGGQTLFVWIIRDISDLKLMHKKIEQSKRLAAIGEMGASIAHEIRNPLAGISAAAQMLLKGTKDNPRHIEVLNEINTLIARIETTVSQMLDYSRSWNPVKAEIYPGQLVQQLISEAKHKKEFANIDFELNCAADLIFALDKERIRQVLWNLYTNAAEAMPDGGTIRTDIFLNERVFIITVRDEGQGIPDKDLDKLFTPFFTTKLYGTGLGLPICQRIIEAHHGTMQIDSNTDEGTTFILRFPIQRNCDGSIA
ncbi:MAG: CHASE4 domain-containing protein [Desulfuromonas sp.]|nr:CHASE4 domain-containing protein [Desulfuromonas sp.]